MCRELEIDGCRTIPTKGLRHVAPEKSLFPKQEGLGPCIILFGLFLAQISEENQTIACFRLRFNNESEGRFTLPRCSKSTTPRSRSCGISASQSLGEGLVDSWSFGSRDLNLVRQHYSGEGDTKSHGLRKHLWRSPAGRGSFWRNLYGEPPVQPESMQKVSLCGTAQQNQTAARADHRFQNLRNPRLPSAAASPLNGYV